MKKTIISALILGMTLSTFSVFAEQENEGGRERENGKKVSVNERSEEVRQNYFSSDSMKVKDDIKTPSIGEVSVVSPVTERTEPVRVSSLSRVKARGAQLIRERINSLTSNSKVISSSNSLTTEQKSTLTSVLGSNIAGLTSLGLSIASSTEATSTKGLIESIYTNFRIFGVVIPQVRLEKRIYDLQNHAAKLSDTFLNVQAKINDYKGKGKDVAVWQKSLDDAKILVATDMYALANLLTKVSALKPSDYGATSTAVIKAANSDIKSIAKDFNTIAKSLNKPKTLKNSTGTSTSPVVVVPIPTPIPAPTPTPTASTFTTAQVATHVTRADCWIIVSGKVYSVTSYISMHPGGSSAIVNYCGQDASTGFSTRGGTGTHSSSARSILGGFLVGTLI